MKKPKQSEFGRKVMCAALTAAMVLAGFTACSSGEEDVYEQVVQESGEAVQSESTVGAGAQTESSAAVENTENSAEQGLPQNVQNYIGQITAIDGSSITVTLAENPAGEEFSGERPSGEMPTGEAPAGERPSGEAPSGDFPKDMPGEMPMTLTGEEMTITVSGSTIITVNGAEATTTDLQVGDMVFFTMEDETVTAVSVGAMQKSAGKGR